MKPRSNGLIVNIKRYTEYECMNFPLRIHRLSGGSFLVEEPETILSNLPTKRYREQHDEIMRLVGEIQGLMQRIGDPEASNECRALLMSMTRKLTVHLSQEDSYLYPRLVGHEDKALRETAIMFQEEMGGLREGAKQWAVMWLAPGAIAREPARFLAETSGLFAQLEVRITREETQLYPLIDKIGWSAVTGVS